MPKESRTLLMSLSSIIVAVGAVSLRLAGI
jgi:hypothetical protein